MRIAHLSWSSVFAEDAAARAPGETPRTTIVIRPEISMQRARGGQPVEVEREAESASPSGFTTSRPGHWNVVVQGVSARASLTAGIWAIEKTAMMIR